MSAHRTHPVLSVYASTTHCGHQHSTMQAAVNCLRNMAHHFKVIRTFQIVQFNEHGESKYVERMLDIGRCTECGNRIVAGTEHELGHYDDCPLVND